MADVAQLNLTAKGAEARLKALMEDVVEYHVDIYPRSRLALAVWYGKNRGEVQQLLELFSRLPKRDFTVTRFSLLWKTGSESPPFVEIHATSVEHFSALLASDQAAIAGFLEEPREILHFDKVLLDESILRAFKIVTEPDRLMKGWYVPAEQYEKLKSPRSLLASYGHLKPNLGLVKTDEPTGSEYCRGLIHVEFDQRWLPVSLAGLRAYTFYNDYLDEKPGVFLFQGGAVYRPLKFEEKTVPDYSRLVLERLPDDRYPEVYLRSMHLPAEPAA